jgi:hypothetical protein
VGEPRVVDRVFWSPPKESGQFDKGMDLPRACLLMALARRTVSITGISMGAACTVGWSHTVVTGVPGWRWWFC